MKIKAWGICQAVWGYNCSTTNIYFDSRKERDRYYNANNYCDKLPCKTVDTEKTLVYDSLESQRALYTGDYEIENLSETMRSRLKDYFKV